MRKKQFQIRAIIALVAVCIMGVIGWAYFQQKEIETSQKTKVETQNTSLLTGGSVPGEYPEGYTGSCTGCEVVSGVVLDSYYDIFVQKFVVPLEEAQKKQ